MHCRILWLTERCDAVLCVCVCACAHARTYACDVVDFVCQAFPLAGRDESARTTSIDVAELIVRPRVGENCPAVTLSVWDFAGDEVFVATHSLFLSTEACYIIVVNLAAGRPAEPAVEWVSSMRAHAPGAVCVVVGTHMDLIGTDRDT